MTSPIAVRDLEGKVALVTGATSGIGQAAAIQLAAQGATVIVHGRDANRGAAVVAEIENGGGSARFVGADLGEPAQALRLAREAGDVDILVNNAGFAWFGPSATLDAKTLDQLFAANVQAPYLLVSVLAPKMVARGDGVIINIASRAGTVGQRTTAAYGATKAALICLKAAPKSRSCRSYAIRRTNDCSVTDPRSGLPPAAWRTRPHRACTAPGTRLFRQDTRIRHRPRPLRLGDRVLPAVLHPDIRRAHGSLA